MQRHSAVLVCTIAAAVLPASAAYAFDPTQSQASQKVAVSQQHAGPGLGSSIALPGNGPGTRLPSFGFGLSATVTPLQGDELRYDIANRGAAGPAINFSPTVSADNAGWHLSWRFGPMRGLSPLNGQGQSRMRFGGRLPGQPRIPGAGHFNIGVHYAFD